MADLSKRLSGGNEGGESGVAENGDRDFGRCLLNVCMLSMQTSVSLRTI